MASIPMSDPGIVLIVHAPNTPSREFLLAAAEATIGRDVNCDITLQTTFASRRHASLAFGADGLMITDHGSRNGTFVNGQRVLASRLVSEGDRITIGDVTLEVRLHPETGVTTHAMHPGLHAPIACDEQTREVWIRGAKLNRQLSAKEFELLNVLCTMPGSIKTRKDLANAVWGEDRSDDNMLHQLMLRLRKKLVASGIKIENIPGVGYRAVTSDLTQT